MILERFVIRRFYGQLLSSLVVTWGVSLVMTQGALLLLDHIIRNVPTPLGNFVMGDFSYSYLPRSPYWRSVRVDRVGMGASKVYLASGCTARATMEDAEMARALGVDVRWMYTTDLRAWSHACRYRRRNAGSPPRQSLPSSARAYTGQAFITVVVGGSGRNLIPACFRARFRWHLSSTVFTSQFNILLRPCQHASVRACRHPLPAIGYLRLDRKAAH